MTTIDWGGFWQLAERSKNFGYGVTSQWANTRHPGVSNKVNLTKLNNRGPTQQCARSKKGRQVATCPLFSGLKNTAWLEGPETRTVIV